MDAKSTNSRGIRLVRRGNLTRICGLGSSLANSLNFLIFYRLTAYGGFLNFIDSSLEPLRFEGLFVVNLELVFLTRLTQGFARWKSFVSVWKLTITRS